MACLNSAQKAKAGLKIVPKKDKDLLKKSGEELIQEATEAEMRRIYWYTRLDGKDIYRDLELGRDGFPGGLLTSTLQPNRTINTFVNKYQEFKLCQAKDCERILAMRPQDYIINPFGNTLIRIFLPKFTPTMKDKASEKLDKLRTFLEPVGA